jgi:hypothetical protein
VAHEVKNPQCDQIHLELLKSQAVSKQAEDAARSPDVITQEIKRLTGWFEFRISTARLM